MRRENDVNIYTFAHQFDFGSPPAISFGSSRGSWSSKRVVIAERLIKAFKFTKAQSRGVFQEMTGPDLWSSITEGGILGLIEAVEKGDPVKLSKLLVEFGGDYTWFGGITTGIDGYNNWDTKPQTVAISYFDHLVSLAESLGVLPCENPEQGRGGNWGRNIALDPGQIISLIEDRLEIKIVPPEGILPVSGIKSAKGLFHYRHINALYLATRIANLVLKSDRVSEYGGGLGFVAFYLYNLGIHDVTLFDLPIINVLSGWFLLSALGEDAVALEGENPGSKASIKIRANWNCSFEKDKTFKLSANQDSFPEIDLAVVNEYLRQIERTSNMFLSINHEVEHSIKGDARHLNVSKLCEDRGKAWRIYRSPYWIRRGYVEELYSFTQNETIFDR